MNATTNTAYHVAVILSNMYDEAAAGNLDINGDLDDWFDTSAIESGADDTDAVYDALRDHNSGDADSLAERWQADATTHGDEEMVETCKVALNTIAGDDARYIALSSLYDAESDAIASGARDE